MTSTGPDPLDSKASGSASGQPDPAEAFAAAMRDLWGFGAAMLHATAASTSQGRDGPEDAFRTLAAPAAGMLGAYADLMSRLSGGRAGGPQGATQDAASQAADLSPALVEAASVAMGSALRYGQALAEVFARHQGNLVKAAAARLANDAAQSPDERHAAAEELRAFLRDVSETAMLEARRLEHELGQVSEAVARAAAPPSPDDPYKRRWSAKP